MHNVMMVGAACANAIPAAVEDRRRRLDMIDVDLGVLARETKIGADHAARIADLNEERIRVAEELFFCFDGLAPEAGVVLVLSVGATACVVISF